MDEKVEAYVKALADMGIGHKVVEHPSLKTPPDVQNYLGLTLADGLATMLMKAGSTFVVIVRRCDTRIDSKKLKKIVGNKLRVANPEEFNEIAGVPLGAARVFMPGLPVYLDEKLFEKDYLTSGSGNFTCSVSVKAEDLKKLPNSQVVSISI